MPLRIAGACLAAAVIGCSAANSLLPSAKPAAETPAPGMAEQAADTQAPSPTPTPTSKPTIRPQPTATATPPCVPPKGADAMRAAQQEADALIPGGNVIWFDDFLCGDLGYGWVGGRGNPRMTITVADGVVTIRTEKYGEVWEGLSRINPSMRDGSGYLVLFRYENGTTGNLALATGEWQTPSNRSWMLSLRFEQYQWAGWEGWEGTDWMNGPFPYAMLRPGSWYYLQMHFETGGKLSAKVWEKDRLENQTEFRRNFGSKWEGLFWTTLFQVYEGAISLDRYWEIKF